MSGRARIALSMHDPAAVTLRDAADAAYRAVWADGANPHPDTYRPLLDALTRPTTVRDEACVRCGQPHDAVWTVRRVVADTLGPWNVYRIAGESWTLPGGGIPLTLSRLPRDAVRLSPADAAAFWHGTLEETE